MYRGVFHIESQIKGVKKGRDQLWVSVLQRCLSYRESNKGNKERQRPTLGVSFTEVSVRESNKGSKERQGPTLSVRFTEMSVL